MKITFRKSIYLLLGLVLMVSCVEDSSEDGVFLRIENQTGYDFQDIEVNFFSGGFSPTLTFQGINDGESSKYLEVSKDSLREDGSYLTFVNAFSESVGFELQIGNISTDFDPERAELLIQGNYTFLLEFVPGEHLTQSLKSEDEVSSDSTFIRIKNNSEKDFLNVHVDFPLEEGNFETVKYSQINAGQSSEYYSPDFSYRYAGITVFTSTDSLKLFPIDYVGEEPIDPGEYSFELNIEIGDMDISRIVKD